MADNEELTEGARFAAHIRRGAERQPPQGRGRASTGACRAGLARIFQPGTSRTVMLAIDHGYFQGPTTGLERVDLSIVPLLGIRGRADDDPRHGPVHHPGYPGVPIVLRASGGPSVLKDLSNEQIAVAMDDAVRLNAAAVAVQVFIGGENETQSVHNMTRLVDEGLRAGVPVLAVTAVGRELTRDARYLRLAVRICAELGAHVVKTYYCPEVSTPSPRPARCRW